MTKKFSSLTEVAPSSLPFFVRSALSEALSCRTSLIAHYLSRSSKEWLYPSRAVGARIRDEMQTRSALLPLSNNSRFWDRPFSRRRRWRLQSTKGADTNAQKGTRGEGDGTCYHGQRYSLHTHV